MDTPAFRPQALKITADIGSGDIPADMKMPNKPTVNLTAVVVGEVIGGEVKYVAQCVEYDICVQASSIKELKERIFKTLRGHVFIAQKCGMQPFASVAAGKPVPEIEWGATEKIGDGAHDLTLQIA